MSGKIIPKAIDLCGAGTANADNANADSNRARFLVLEDCTSKVSIGVFPLGFKAV
jgi:hypothetical protein